MMTKALKVYRIFQQTYSNENAKTIVTFIMNKKQEEINEMKKVFLTKDDKVDLIKGQRDIQADLLKSQREIQADLIKGQMNIQADLLKSQREIQADLLKSQMNIINTQKSDKTELLGHISKLKDEMHEGFSTLELRLDTHFKWLIGIMLTLFGLAFTLHKLL